MFGGEGVAIVDRRECVMSGGRGRGIEGHLQRGHVRLNQDVRREDLGGEIHALAVAGLIRGKGGRLEVGTGAVGAWLGKPRVLMTAHVVPRPAEESALRHAGHVVRNQVIAQVVPLIGGAPQLSRAGIDGFTHTVPDSVCIDLNELALRSELQHVRAVELTGVGVRVIHVGTGTHGDQHVPAVFAEDHVTGPVAASRQLSVARDVGHHGFRGAAGVEVALGVGEALNGRGIADVDKLRMLRRIERDTKGMVQSGGELLNLGGFAVATRPAQHEERARAGVSHKQIAVRGDGEKARFGESSAAELHVLLVIGPLHWRCIAAGIERHLETGGRDRPGVGRPGNELRRVVHRFSGLGLGQIRQGNLVANAGVLLGPVGEGSLPGQHRALRLPASQGRQSRRSGEQRANSQAAGREARQRQAPSRRRKRVRELRGTVRHSDAHLLARLLLVLFRPRQTTGG